MKPIEPKLIGSWISLDELDESEEDEDYSPAVFTISTGKNGYEVAAIAPSDGEAANISNITWDGKSLAFDCIFSSTDYPTKQAISLQSDGDATAEYTIWEIWKKIPESAVQKWPSPLVKSAMPASSTSEIDPQFLGTWVTEDEDSEATFAVSQGETGYEVAGFDRQQGDSFRIENVAWDGTSLSFEVYLDDEDSEELLSKNAFTLLTDGTADLQLTLFDVWRKVIAVGVEG